MSTENIIEKIREKSAQEIAAIQAASKEKIAAVRQAASDRADEQCRQIADNTQAQTAEIARRGALMNDLAARKASLAAKRTVLDEAFAAAKQQLLAMPGDKKVALMRRLIVSTAPSGDVKVRVPAVDKALYTDALLTELSAELTAARGVPCSLTADTAPATCDGGVQLVTAVADMDLSFDTLLHAVREQQENAVAAVLFPA